MSEEPPLNRERATTSMPNQPLVSIVVPVYNAESTIGTTLDALTSQTLEDIEIICINDGSSDNTEAVLAQASQKDNRIKVVSTPNQGACRAREEGLSCALGSYIGFCDADDIPLPDMYETLYKNATRNNSDIVVCPYTREKNGTTLATEMIKANRYVLPVSDKSGWVTAVNTALWNKLYKRDVLADRIHLNNTPKIGEDAIFFLSVIPSAKRLSFVHEPKYRYQVQDGSAMSSVTEEEVEAILDAWKELRSHIERRNASYLQIIDSAAFIHLGVSLPVVLSKQGDARLAVKIFSCLDESFPLHRKSNFFAAGYAKEYPDFMKLACMAHKLYRAKLLMPGLKAYQAATNLLNIDIKW